MDLDKIFPREGPPVGATVILCVYSSLAPHNEVGVVLENVRQIGCSKVLFREKAAWYPDSNLKVVDLKPRGVFA